MPQPSTRAVDRALDILLCFSRDEPTLTLTQIVERVGMHKSTVHRLLATLERKRFLQRAEENGSYRLGLALLELGRRIATADRGAAKDMSEIQNVITELKYLQQEKTEHFVVLLLDTQLQLIRRQTVHIGTLDQSLAGVREVFREAIQAGAASIILAHNHPSGDPTPSPEDRLTTREFSEAGQILNIHVIDHVIVGNPQSFSFTKAKFYGEK